MIFSFSNRKWFATFFFLFQSAYALEVDEKLTMRILKNTASRKTMLGNRGIEDGLKQGDHAKFFLSEGVIARGEVVKVSPTRSIWSLYRVSMADEIAPDKVVNLKITEPVELTYDPTRTIIKDDTPVSARVSDPRQLGIPLADGADDLGDPDAYFLANGERCIPVAKIKNLIEKSGGQVTEETLTEMQLPEEVEVGESQIYSESADLGEDLDEQLDEDLGEDISGSSVAKISRTSGPGQLSGRSFEFMAGMNYLSLNVPAALDTQEDVGLASLQFFVGGEYYFGDTDSFLHRLSLAPYFATGTTPQSYDVGEVEGSNTEIGGSLIYHPFTHHRYSNAFIPFVQVGVFTGAVADFFPVDQGGDLVLQELNASSFGYFGGVGGKYFFKGGLGLRAVADYYTRSETYSFDDNQEDITRSVSGPKNLIHR